MQAKFDPAMEGMRPAQGPSVRGGLECLFFSVQLWMPSSTLPLTGAPEMLVASGGWGCLHLAGVGSALQDRKGCCFPPGRCVLPSGSGLKGGPQVLRFHLQLQNGEAPHRSRCLDQWETRHTFQELTYPAGETAAGVFACL